MADRGGLIPIRFGKATRASRRKTKDDAALRPSSPALSLVEGFVLRPKWMRHGHLEMVFVVVLVGNQGVPMTLFRPCIDLHQGVVKQIVGSTLSDGGERLVTNGVSDRPASYFAG